MNFLMRSLMRKNMRGAKLLIQIIVLVLLASSILTLARFIPGGMGFLDRAIGEALDATQLGQTWVQLLAGFFSSAAPIPQGIGALLPWLLRSVLFSFLDCLVLGVAVRMADILLGRGAALMGTLLGVVAGLAVLAVVKATGMEIVMIGLLLVGIALMYFGGAGWALGRLWRQFLMPMVPSAVSAAAGVGYLAMLRLCAMGYSGQAWMPLKITALVLAYAAVVICMALWDRSLSKR